MPRRTSRSRASIRAIATNRPQNVAERTKFAGIRCPKSVALWIATANRPRPRPNAAAAAGVRPRRINLTASVAIPATNKPTRTAPTSPVSSKSCA